MGFGLRGNDQRRRRTVGGAVILILAVFGPATLYAQAPSIPASAVLSSKPDAGASEPDARAVRLLVGRSTVVNVDNPITRVSLTSADIADALVTSPTELLVNGKMPGTISMFVWGRGATSPRRYEIVVQRDLGRLTEQFKQLFPGEAIDVQSNGKNVVLSGKVSNKDIIEKAVNLASGYVEKKEEVVSLLQIRDGAPSNQVLLRVRFAEVSRSAMTELASSFAANGAKDGRWFGRTTTEQYPAPFWNQDGKFTFNDFLNLFLYDTKSNLAAVVKALQTRGLFQSLAEPNLVAESGKEASFLAGGEYPIPIAQPSGGAVMITVQFKEFGVRLNFTPIVNGDRIHLKVRPEVSSLDFNNAVVLQGFRIPALSTRRTETELELQNHQTFAISGLINNTMLSSMQKIPGIGDIPILGLLFRSKAAQKDQTELVVMITPEILPNNSTGVTPNVPKLIEPYLSPVPPKKQIEPPPPAFQPEGGRTENVTPITPVAAAHAPASSGASNAQSAADAVTALTPNTRTVVDGNATPQRAGAKPQTADQKRALEQSRKLEQEQREVAAKKAAEQARLKKEQDKKDAEAAKKAAEQAKKQAERQAEIDRKAAEVRKREQKAIAEAEARLKAAEAEYQAEADKLQVQR